MPSLRVAERIAGEKATGFGRVVVRDCSFEPLALGGGLPELPAKPAQQAHRLLIGRLCHVVQLTPSPSSEPRRDDRVGGVDTLLAIASRRDERRMIPGALPPELAWRLLDAGRLSGSAGNRQPWTFVVPTSRARIETLAETVYVPENVLSAGLVVAVVVSGKGPVSFDAGRAAQSMLLAAWAEGLASCPNGIADPETARIVLGAAEDEKPVIVLSFGFPERPRDVDARTVEEWSARANRRPLEELVRWLP